MNKLPLAAALAAAFAGASPIGAEIRSGFVDIASSGAALGGVVTGLGLAALQALQLLAANREQIALVITDP